MRCNSTGKLGRVMLALLSIFAAVSAVFALFVENILSGFLFFTAGWANGWPYGLQFQTVLSAGITIHQLFQLMTASVAVAAIIGFICTLLGIRWERVGRGYAIWIWFVVISVCICALIFWRNYVWVWEQFPDGYIIT